MPTFILIMLIALACMLMAAKSMAVAKEGERLVVFRLGQFLRVYPAGLAILIPFVDQGVRVSVERVAGWQALSERELDERIIQIALNGLSNPSA